MSERARQASCAIEQPSGVLVFVLTIVLVIVVIAISML
jgi:hypothetical protein